MVELKLEVARLSTSFLPSFIFPCALYSVPTGSVCGPTFVRVSGRRALLKVLAGFGGFLGCGVYRDVDRVSGGPSESA